MSNAWAPFRSDNTDGYTATQLSALNRAFELAVISHLSGSAYEENDEIDAEQWRNDDSDGYKAMAERVQRNYDDAAAA